MSVLEEGYIIEEGGSDKISKMLQEVGHFLIRGGSANQKCYKRGSLIEEGGLRRFTFL